ncbi:MAG: DUF481 domain-containing protein [Deltaproteobacteria bacterium]|nr:DUF481 domain-containing protein [Deltaproteobacteria bacterium]MCL4873783.1 DUF481 domain-containing protein [bacterium]
MASTLVAGVATVSSADELVLSNGDTITGKVQGMEKGVLTVGTPYSEPVRIRKSSVAALRTDGPVTVRTASGEIWNGSFLINEAGQTVFKPAERPWDELAWADIDAIDPATPRLGGKISAGASMRSGNTRRASVNIGFDAEKRTLQDRSSASIRFNYAEENGRTTARNSYAALKYDYFLTSPYYGYLSAELLNDRFRDIDLRAVAGPGAGYQVWDGASKSLLIELGLSLVREELRSGRDESWVTARVGSNLRLGLTKDTSFNDGLKAYSRVDEPENFQVRNEASLNSRLNSYWSLKLTNIIEYDSKPPVNIKKTDIYWILSLQYTF